MYVVFKNTGCGSQRNRMDERKNAYLAAFLADFFLDFFLGGLSHAIKVFLPLTVSLKRIEDAPAHITSPARPLASAFLKILANPAYSVPG